MLNDYLGLNKTDGRLGTLGRLRRLSGTRVDCHELLVFNFILIQWRLDEIRLFFSNNSAAKNVSEPILSVIEKTNSYLFFAIFFLQNYAFWSHFHLNMDERLGADWDIYAMTMLAILVGLLILFRWR